MDKDKIPYHLLPEDACLNEQQLYGYMDGTLSYPEQHAVEKHLLDCDFCSDALAGLELVSDRSRVAAVPPVAAEKTVPPPVTEPKKEKGKIIPFYRSGRTYAAAAALVLIVAVTWFFNNTAKNESAVQLSDHVATNKAAEEPAAAMQTTAESLAAAEEQRIVTNVPAEQDGEGAEKNTSSAQNQFEDLDKSSKAPMPQSPVAAGTYEFAEKPKAIAADKKTIAREETVAADGADYLYRDDANLKDERKKEQLNERAGDFAINTMPAKEAEKMDLDAGYKTQADTVKLVANNAALASGTSATLSPAANGGATYTWSPGTTDSFSKPAGTNVGFSATGATTVIQSQPLQTEVVTSSTRATNKFDLFKDNTAKKSKAAAVPAASAESQKTGPLSDNEKYNRALAEINSNRNESALLMLNDILTNSASPLYADAQWQKAVVLIKLNKKAEAKTILQEIVKKGGKYKPLAESQLKQL